MHSSAGSQNDKKECSMLTKKKIIQKARESEEHDVMEGEYWVYVSRGTNAVIFWEDGTITPAGPLPAYLCKNLKVWEAAKLLAIQGE